MLDLGLQKPANSLLALGKAIRTQPSGIAHLPVGELEGNFTCCLLSFSRVVGIGFPGQ